MKLIIRVGKKMSPRRPLVGILLNITLANEISQIVKKIRPEIRLDVIVHGKPEISAEELKSLKSCEVLIVDPKLVAEHDLTFRLPTLKWMYSYMAGVDRLTRSLSRSGPFPNYILTRNGGYFGSAMAEYVLGYIIAKERHLFVMKELHQQKSWIKLPYRSLSDLTLGIIGFGDIGQEIARIANSFQMKIVALVKNLPEEKQKCPVVDKYWLNSNLPEFLSTSDYVVSVLPSISSTDGILDGDVLSNCSTKKSVFINIGRSNVIKEETIIKALDSDWISAAVLDVFDVEPLPLESPLWTHPGVTITPHISGITDDKKKIAEDFVRYYDQFLSGKPISFTVDWAKGY